MDVEPLGRPARWRVRAAVLATVVSICGPTAPTPTFRESAPPLSLHGHVKGEPLPAGDAPAFLTPRSWVRVPRPSFDLSHFARPKLITASSGRRLMDVLLAEEPPTVATPCHPGCWITESSGSSLGRAIRSSIQRGREMATPRPLASQGERSKLR